MSPYPTKEDLLAEEAGLVLDRFDYESAWDLGAQIRRVAMERRLPIAIEVVHGTTPVFLSLLPGATPNNVEWIRRKRAVAQRFHHSSLYMRLLSEANGVSLHARHGLAEADFAASGGAVPVFVRDVGLVGVATVSGLPDLEDHRLVVAGLRNLNQGVRGEPGGGAGL